MQTYTISNPPDVPGIYLLKNETTGQLYVGKTLRLKRRYREWRVAINANCKLHSTAIGDAIDGHWTFSVLAEVPEVDLAACEVHAIARLKGAASDRLLNFTAPATNRGEGAVQKSAVIGPEGRMLYASVADALGISREAVKKKLATLRARGVTEITLEDLKNTRRR